MTKKFTVKDVYEAIKKNGYPWTTGIHIQRVDYNDGSGPTVVGACAIGQAALNLGLDPDGKDDIELQKMRMQLTGMVGAIETCNDDDAKEYADVVEYAREIMEPRFDEVITID